MVNYAIRLRIPHILDMFGDVPIMFKKGIQRADNKRVERYNHKLGIWEPMPGIPRVTRICVIEWIKAFTSYEYHSFNLKKKLKTNWLRLKNSYAE